MTKSTQFLNKLGLQVPIIQAPMSGISTVKMAAETANFGALGSLAMASIDLTKGVCSALDQIQQFRALTNKEKKVNVNFFHHDHTKQTPPTQEQIKNWYTLFSSCSNMDEETISQTIHTLHKLNVSFEEFELFHPQQLKTFIRELGELNVGVVSFHFGPPLKSTLELLQKTGIMVLVTVTSVPEALDVTELGVDGIVCQGYEAGGHRGNYLDSHILDENLSTEALFLQIKEALRLKESELSSVPYIIPAGGIVDGATAARYLNQGAAAVQMGTVFVPALESNAPNFIPELVRKRQFVPTVMTPLASGKSARMIKTPFIERLIKEQSSKILDLPSYGYYYSGFKQFTSFENTDYGCYLIGENYHFVSGPSSTNTILQILADDLFPRLNFPLNFSKNKK